MKFVKSAVLAFGLLLLAHGTASAQAHGRRPTRPPDGTPFSDLRAIGAGLVIIGAAMGIGGLARRPSRAWPASPRSPATSRRP